MAARIVDKQEKRRMILGAALQVFARQGIDGFKMIQVAEAAGVGKGTLYEYFPSKEKLIGGSLALFLSEYSEFVEKRLLSIDDPADRIKELIGASMAFFAKDQDRLFLVFDLWGTAVSTRRGRHLFEETESIYRKAHRWVTDIIGEGIRRGVFREVEVGLSASMILATLDGLLFQAVLGVFEINDEEISHNISNIILNGLLK